MDKQFFVQVVNLNEGKIFSLPTLYTDRTEACVCGQNYIRDRQAEDYSVNLFFRVLISENGVIPPACSLWDDEDDEDRDCNCFDCPHCGSCFGESVDEPNDDEEDSEEPDWEHILDTVATICALDALGIEDV